MKKTLLTLAIAALAGTASAGVLLSEGFESVAGLTAKGWIRNNSQSTPGGQVTAWAQGNSSAFSAASGTPNSYVSAIYTNAPDGGLVSNWLLTPLLNGLSNSASLNFDLRLLGDGFLDTVEVYVNTSASTTNLANFVLLGSFSSDADTGWVNENVALSGINGFANGRLGFRYFVADTSTAGNFVGIDNVSVVPEPSSIALFGIAALGLFASRRKAAAKR